MLLMALFDRLQVLSGASCTHALGSAQRRRACPLRERQERNEMGV